MSLAFDISGNLKLSLYDGGELQPVPFALTGSFTVRAGGVYTLTGAGTTDVDIGSVSAVKALLILVGTQTGAAEIGVRLNGQTESMPVSPGGGVLIWSPSPSTPISLLRIEHASDITIQVVALGEVDVSVPEGGPALPM